MIAFTVIPGCCGVFAGRTYSSNPNLNPDLTLTQP